MPQTSTTLPRSRSSAGHAGAILAADIGGTNSRLLACDAGGERIAERVYPSGDYQRLDDLVADFVRDTGLSFEAACFGLPGPVIGGRCRLTNNDWEDVEATALSATTGIPHLTLINDVEANAYGIPELAPDALLTLNAGHPVEHGAIAVVSPGTGLGEAALMRVDGVPVAIASEGGHADFGPLSPMEWELVRHVQQQGYNSVTHELLISGPGLERMYALLRERSPTPAPDWLARRLEDGEGAAAIGEAGVSGSDPVCREAVDLWVSVLAAEASNAAVKFLAVGGVYIGGGIAPKLVERLRQPGFMARFTAKDKLSAMLETIPVHLVLDDTAALRGARARALRLHDSLASPSREAA